MILEGNGTATLTTVSGGKLWLMMNNSSNIAVKDEGRHRRRHYRRRAPVERRDPGRRSRAASARLIDSCGRFRTPGPPARRESVGCQVFLFGGVGAALRHELSFLRSRLRARGRGRQLPSLQLVVAAGRVRRASCAPPPPGSAGLLLQPHVLRRRCGTRSGAADRARGAGLPRSPPLALSRLISAGLRDASEVARVDRTRLGCLPAGGIAWLAWTGPEPPVPVAAEVPLQRGDLLRAWNCPGSPAAQRRDGAARQKPFHAVLL